MKKVLISMMVLPMLCACQKSDFQVKEDLTVEYGETLSTNVKDYLALDENIDDETKKDILQNTTLLISDDVKEEGKEYQKVGDYHIQLQYLKEEKEITVHITDTTNPQFVDFKEQLTTYKDVPLDILKNYQIQDLSPTKLSVDDSKIDYSQVGTYEATISAIDDYGNKSHKTITVEVKNPTLTIDQTKMTVYKGNSKTLKTTVKGKEKQASYLSSDSKIATVSSKGKVTAKSVGTTTITVKANGIEKTCQVTVKNPPLSAKEKRLQEAKKEAKRVVKKIINHKMSQYDKAKAIYNYLHSNVSIQNNQSNAAYRKNFGNEAYAALIMKKAACSGYCRAATLMLNEAGLQSRHINAGKWQHQWNEVKINGKWIVLDAQGGIFGLSEHPIVTYGY